LDFFMVYGTSVFTGRRTRHLASLPRQWMHFACPVPCKIAAPIPNY
jgi:hypothetical protein